MTRSTRAPTSVQERRAQACPSSVLRAASGPSQGLSGRSPSRTPLPRLRFGAESASMKPPLSAVARDRSSRTLRRAHDTRERLADRVFFRRPPPSILTRAFIDQGLDRELPE